MPRTRRSRSSNRERSLVFVVALSFALAIASFVTARVITEVQARYIAAQADSITDNALVAAERLIEARTRLRAIAMDLTSLRASTPEFAEELALELERARLAFRVSWERYLSVPFLPDERAIASSAETDLVHAGRLLDEVVARVREGDREGAVRLADESLLPTIVSAADALDTLLQLNRRAAQEAAGRIALTTRSRGYVLEIFGVCFAIASAFFGVRVLRRYLAVSAERSRELEGFAGRVAHDIRSPLGAATLALDIAKRGPGIDERTQALLARVTRSMQHVAQLVDGLLLFATSGGYIVPGAAVETCAPVRTVLDGVAEDAALQAEQIGVQLDYEAPDPKLVVACSSGVLISMTTNVLSNAMKFMGDSPVRRISMRARRVGNEVRIEIADTGPGIPAGLREAVFQPFVRGASTAPGYGLGLATVQKLAEAHGGRVGIEPGAERGVTVWMCVPIGPEARERKAWVVPRPLHAVH